MRFLKIVFIFVLLIILAISAYKIFSLLSPITNSSITLFLIINFSIGFLALLYLLFIEISRLFTITLDLQKKHRLLEEEKKSTDSNSSPNNLFDELAKKKSEELLSRVRSTISKKLEKSLLAQKILGDISKIYELVQGEVYFVSAENKTKLKLEATYAYYLPEGKVAEQDSELGLIGQVARNKAILNLDNVPENYIKVVSGLGNSTPQNLVIVPLLYKELFLGVIELASFKPFGKSDENILTETAALIAEYFSNEFINTGK